MQIGDRIDRYVVERALGEGGMATVYLARHDMLRSLHALKVLRIDVPSIKQRLITEGRVQAALRHPNIVAVTDVLDDGNVCALVMEYVEGPALDEWIYDASVEKDLPSVLAMFRSIALGVAAAHRAGLVHRDLKPDNVLLAPSNAGLIPKVTDFGLVKVLASSGTQSGVLMGTPEYMSPEQVRDSASVDARTDLWALGVLLYEMLTGEVPFSCDEIHATYAQIVDEDFPPLRDLRPDVPERIEEVVNQLLAKDPDDRFQTAEEMLERLFPGGAVITHQPQLATGQLLPTEEPTVVPTLVPEHPTGVVVADVTAPMEPLTNVPLAPGRSRLSAPVALSLGVAAGVALFVAVLLSFVAVVGLPERDQPEPEASDPAPAPVEPVVQRAPVQIRVPLPDAVLRLDGEPLTTEDGVASLDLEPGSYEVLAQIGSCPAQARDCRDACPPGCGSVVQTIQVVDEPVAVELPLVVGARPAPAPAQPEPAPPPVQPQPPPQVGRVVTASAYASWLARNPEWSKEQAVQTGRADATYLRKWNPDPPAGPLTHVPWRAAQAYCESRGGLADLAAGPLTWDWKQGVQIEWRDAGGKPGFRQYDGVTSTANPGNRGNAVTGVRCRR